MAGALVGTPELGVTVKAVRESEGMRYTCYTHMQAVHILYAYASGIHTYMHAVHMLYDMLYVYACGTYSLRIRMWYTCI